MTPYIFIHDDGELNFLNKILHLSGNKSKRDIIE